MSAATSTRMNGRRMAWLMVVAGAVLFVGANVHLVHVALTSEPDCVDHLKTEGQDGHYRAARPAC